MFFRWCCLALLVLMKIRSYSPLGIILSGGPSSVYDKDAPNMDRRVFELGLPVLGICYGLQLMVHALGGKVRAADKREYGHAAVEVKEVRGFFIDVPQKLFCVDVAWRRSRGFAAGLSLGRQFDKCCRRYRETATKRCGQSSFTPKYDTRQSGADILRNFALEICGAKPTGLRSTFIDSTIASVRQTVGNGRAICALSGGVDSAVAATLVDRALRNGNSPSRLTSVFVNMACCVRTNLKKFSRTCATSWDCTWSQWMRPIASSASWRAWLIQRRNARLSATNLSLSSTSKAASRRERRRRSRMAGAGDALSRRDRIALGARAIADY